MDTDGLLKGRKVTVQKKNGMASDGIDITGGLIIKLQMEVKKIAHAGELHQFDEEMHLCCIDIGNTTCRGAIWTDGKFIQQKVIEQ